MLAGGKPLHVEMNDVVGSVPLGLVGSKSLLGSKQAGEECVRAIDPLDVRAAKFDRNNEQPVDVFNVIWLLNKYSRVQSLPIHTASPTGPTSEQWEVGAQSGFARNEIMRVIDERITAARPNAERLQAVIGVTTPRSVGFPTQLTGWSSAQPRLPVSSPGRAATPSNDNWHPVEAA